MLYDAFILYCDHVRNLFFLIWIGEMLFFYLFLSIYWCVCVPFPVFRASTSVYCVTISVYLDLYSCSYMCMIVKCVFVCRWKNSIVIMELIGNAFEICRHFIFTATTFSNINYGKFYFNFSCSLPIFISFATNFHIMRYIHETQCFSLNHSTPLPSSRTQNGYQCYHHHLHWIEATKPSQNEYSPEEHRLLIGW